MDTQVIREKRDLYNDLAQKGHLSEKGLLYYIDLLEDRITDYTERINKTLQD